MLPRSPQPLHPAGSAPDEDGSNDTSPSDAPAQTAETTTDRALSRRRVLAGGVATASVGLAGCTAHLPGNAASVDCQRRLDGDTLVWSYPAGAAQGDGDALTEGIGYAAIRFRAFDAATDQSAVAPTVRFRLNSTVGESDRGYKANWFRFRIGVPRTDDDVSGLRASVQPPQWPEVQTTYGYEGATRDLLVEAPNVNEAGTVTVDGRFRSSGTTLPRRLHCQFEVKASQSGSFGRTVRAEGHATFDVSELALPAEITVL